MKARFLAAAIVTAALSFGAAGPAGAQRIAHYGNKGSAPPQVTGSRLQSALLPPSAFGPDFTFSASLNTGGKLQTTRAKYHVPSMGCSAFESKIWVSFFGDTAGAAERFQNPNAAAGYPDSIFDADEDVLQFATAAAAATFYGQVQAKYPACRSFTETTPPSTFQVTNLSVTKTTVSGAEAFTVTQDAALAGFRRGALYFNYLYAISGADVYLLFAFSGTNDVAFPAQMAKLTHRVQALYPHRK